jgi:hypothetical protein
LSSPEAALRRLGSILLGSASDPRSVERACLELYDLFTAAAVVAADAVLSTVDRRLESGLALSPALAATCLLDGPRTQAFVRGTLRAIQDAARKRDRVEVLYAGTGPFAPLALLTIPFLDRGRVAFTLLDVNAESCRAVSALVDALGMRDCVRDVVCADATTYRHPAPIDVLVSETMQRSLAEEPFVAIIRNFRPQLAPGGVVVPERVTIALALLDPATEQARWRGETAPFAAVPLMTVFEIDARREWLAGRSAAVGSAGDRCESRWLALLTRIVVYHDEVLEPYACGLTMPEILWRASPVTRELVLDFRYVEGSRPRLEYACFRGGSVARWA